MKISQWVIVFIKAVLFLVLVYLVVTMTLLFAPGNCYDNPSACNLEVK